MIARAAYLDVDPVRHGGRPVCPRCGSAATVSLGTARSTLDWWRCEDCSFVCGLRPEASDQEPCGVVAARDIVWSDRVRARLSSMLIVTANALWPAPAPVRPSLIENHAR